MGQPKEKKEKINGLVGAKNRGQGGTTYGKKRKEMDYLGLKKSGARQL